MLDPVTFNGLRRFRAAVSATFGIRRDALFELLDAATVAGLVPSLAHLSLTAVHRRRWGSLDDALAFGTMDAPALWGLIGQWPLDDGQPISAWDARVWPRDDAETSPGRGYHSSASRQSAGQPIVAGWSSGWLAQVGFTHDNWTALLDVFRVAPTDDAHAGLVRVDRGARPHGPPDGGHLGLQRGHPRVQPQDRLDQDFLVQHSQLGPAPAARRGPSGSRIYHNADMPM